MMYWLSCGAPQKDSGHSFVSLSDFDASANFPQSLNATGWGFAKLRRSAAHNVYVRVYAVFFSRGFRVARRSEARFIDIDKYRGIIRHSFIHSSPIGHEDFEPQFTVDEYSTLLFWSRRHISGTSACCLNMTFECYVLGLWISPTVPRWRTLPTGWHRRTSLSSLRVVTIADCPPNSAVNVGDRASPVAASRVWNNLPQHVTAAESLPVFCTCLKTHLFRRCFLWHIYCCRAREVTVSFRIL